MDKQPNYRSTMAACCLGMLVMAAAANLTPILFIPLREQFGLSFAELGSLVLINFLTQVTCDFAFSKAIDKHGFRPFVVTAQALCFAGFLLFAFVPVLFKGNTFLGFAIATVIFSGSAGLCELLLSPIIDALPLGNKNTVMAFLHSFYAWGSVAVILITTVFLYVCGRDNWQWIVLAWMVVPVVTGVLFCKVPLRNKASEMQVMRIRALVREPIFLLAFFAIALGGAAEVTMSQWTSAYMETVLGLPKLVGDTLGMCMFALLLGLGRLLYGKLGHRMDLNRVLIFGACGAAVCYLVVAVSPVPALSLTACGLCGLCTSLLWPGTLTFTSERLPMAGASMFALLAAGGDIGAAAGPAATGMIAEYAESTGLFAGTPEQAGMRLALLLAAAVPLLCAGLHVALRRKSRNQPSAAENNM